MTPARSLKNFSLSASNGERAGVRCRKLLVRPHARAQAVGDVVRALERLLRRAERHHAQHRSENFLRRHAMRVRDARLRGRSRSVAAKAREKRLRDNSVENSVKHFQFNANWRKLFGELGQIFLTETVLALN